MDFRINQASVLYISDKQFEGVHDQIIVKIFVQMLQHVDVNFFQLRHIGASDLDFLIVLHNVQDSPGLMIYSEKDRRTMMKIKLKKKTFGLVVEQPEFFDILTLFVTLSQSFLRIRFNLDDRIGSHEDQVIGDMHPKFILHNSNSSYSFLILYFFLNS